MLSEFMIFLRILKMEFVVIWVIKCYALSTGMCFYYVFYGESMNEVTQIAYGEGTVTISLQTESLSEVSAPNIRFGDYTEVIESCFTQKELNVIQNGEVAELDFVFVMSDTLDNKAKEKEMNSTMESLESSYGTLHEGVFIDMTASKSLADSELSDISYISSASELLIDIPLYLVKEDRSYYLVSRNMGDDALLENVSTEANTLAVKINTFSTSMMVFQDNSDRAAESLGSHFYIPSKVLLIGGMVILAGLWLGLDKLHRVPQEQS